jgi:hypothetical protein
MKSHDLQLSYLVSRFSVLASYFLFLNLRQKPSRSKKDLKGYIDCLKSHVLSLTSNIYAYIYNQE